MDPRSRSTTFVGIPKCSQVGIAFIDGRFSGTSCRKHQGIKLRANVVSLFEHSSHDGSQFDQFETRRFCYRKLTPCFAIHLPFAEIIRNSNLAEHRRTIRRFWTGSQRFRCIEWCTQKIGATTKSLNLRWWRILFGNEVDGKRTIWLDWIEMHRLMRKR